MNQSEAAQQILIRPWYHGPLGIVGIATLILYSYELRILHQRRKTSPFNSLFFSLWKNQAIIDIFVLIHYLLAGFFRNFPITWNFFLSLNGSVFPIILECFMVFQVTSELGGVTLISLHRFIAVCFPVSNLMRRIDHSPRIFLTFCQIFLSIPLLIPFVTSQPAYYYFEPYNTGVQLFTNHHALIQSLILGLFCLTSTTICFICYCFVFHRISRVSRRKGRVNSQEVKTTTLAFALFCSLILYFIFTFIAALATALKLPNLLVFIQAYIFFPTFILAITNPWCLILSGALRTSRKSGGSTVNRASTAKTIFVVQSTRSA